MAIFTDRVHLTGQTLIELHQFAELIGISKTKYVEHIEHPFYIIPKTKIQAAINMGAKMVSESECLRAGAACRLTAFDMQTDAIEHEIGEPVYHGHIISEHFGLGLYGFEHDHELLRQIPL
jgi:hypothetical protein